MLVAYLFVLSLDGYGQGDLRPFGVYTIFLSILSVLWVGLYNRAFERVNLAVGLILLVVFTLLQTQVFNLLLWYGLGPWIGAISFPYVLCWIAGIFFANLFLLINSKNKFKLRNLLIISGVVSFICLVSIVKDALAEQQNYDIICLEHRPNEEAQTTAEDLLRFGLSEAEASEIIKYELGGTLSTKMFFRVSESNMVSTYNPEMDFETMEYRHLIDLSEMFANSFSPKIKINPNKIILILNQPLKENYKFYEPLNSSLIVIQDSTGNNFKKVYLGDDRNSKKIEIKNTDFKESPNSTSIIIDLKGKSDFQIDGFKWRKKNDD
jgi:hypothetical protein